MYEFRAQSEMGWPEEWGAKGELRVYSPHRTYVCFYTEAKVAELSIQQCRDLVKFLKEKIAKDLVARVLEGAE